jgi:hypothetical protein
MHKKVVAAIWDNLGRRGSSREKWEPSYNIPRPEEGSSSSKECEFPQNSGTDWWVLNQTICYEDFFQPKKNHCIINIGTIFKVY